MLARIAATSLALWLGLALPGAAQLSDELALARQVLASVQAASFDRNREFCGMLGRTKDGRLVASKPRRGRRVSCLPRRPFRAKTLVASYHTHGAYKQNADGEVPSLDDVLGDMDDGVDGYLATPGGRFWYIDGTTGVSRQICGLGCLPQDPGFIPGAWGPVRKVYTLEQLARRFGGG
ncbi:hypothetical protein AIOL_003696 [Candidatus Rhodobacter oscarellae]|uniref:DUF4329 domain-containing protein n=1 Tax=Candidatus Rhodobacter oscarellae TaxID=1675527 RepID=A0A0J9E7M9_9RHOB|nr:DUF4329 domain-containing protein [Candidatus Rhodobacter lobularis]KMW58717.1 hypothetical protein AIOL_003696 [Candidatus Rhodobacter lobularis]